MLSIKMSQAAVLALSLTTLASGAAGCCMGGGTTTTTSDPLPGLPATATAPAAPAAAPSAATQQVSIAPGFAAQTLSGTAGGPTQASSLDSSCRGYIGTSPSVELTLSAPMPLVTIQATAERDTTMVIQRPDGTYLCNDDYNGLNPGVSEPFTAAGVYRVFIGTYSASAAGAAYTLNISPLPGDRGY